MKLRAGVAATSIAILLLVACASPGPRTVTATAAAPTTTAPSPASWPAVQGTTTTTAPPPTTTTAPRVVAQEAERAVPAAVTSKPAASSHDWSSPVGQAIRRHFPANWQRMGDIFWCESRWTPTAVSRGGGNHGIAQINNVHADSFAAITGRPWLTGRYEIDANLTFAKYLYDHEGERPWSCARMV